MKNYLEMILAIIILLTTNQIVGAQKSQLLLKGGVNYYSLKGIDVSVTNDTTFQNFSLGKIGYNFGYGYEYSFTQKQSILLGLEFSYKSAKHNKSDDYLDPIFYYMDMPIAYNYHIAKKLKLSVGGQISYLLKKRPFRYRNQITDESGLLNYDFGLSYGIRYRVWDLEFEAKGVYGLVEFIHTTPTPDFHSEIFAKSRSLSFSCSYVID